MTIIDRTFGGVAGRRAIVVVGMAIMLAACGDGGGDNASVAAPVAADVAVTSGNAAGSAPVALPVPDTAEAQTRADDARAFFLGTWTGPEGLSFVVEAAADGGYHVRNQDTLDDHTTFDARLDGRTMRFVRRGQALVARPGTGTETGFKWLANKRDCLIVQPGVEGYCRD